MNAKHSKPSAGAVVKDIRRATRKQYGAEEKIRIVLEGLRGEDSIAELCRREGPMVFGRRACITNGRRTSWTEPHAHDPGDHENGEGQAPAGRRHVAQRQQ